MAPAAGVAAVGADGFLNLASAAGDRSAHREEYYGGRAYYGGYGGGYRRGRW